MKPPSPTFCLRQSPAGYWYRLPFIYEYDWEQWCASVRERAEAKEPTPSLVLELPKYAVPVNLHKLTFQQPADVA